MFSVFLKFLLLKKYYDLGDLKLGSGVDDEIFMASKSVDADQDDSRFGEVTETADFQKDLDLDSLDRVELIMALEEEFSIEIPDEKADKLTCCTDVAKYSL
ncbi:acyl carrier protein mitochondrial-like [Trifolium pratense]|uniref:Acyl carrier protein n=1 Tax=Trifolium pratense TaxID=57577 RepID=A0A2K3KZ27_TRIPR|nr:acyl carrier protein mitochondrial-like [Trifolium pratense]